MSLSSLTPVLQGATAALACVGGLFFWCFWRRSRDRFFIFFALSFWIESANWLHLGLSAQVGEDAPANYAVRLIAYLLILAAIWDKNRPRP
jgi:hypothetical protein